MQSIRVEDAAGTVLCHDITKIVPNEFKGRAFTKGHVIVEEDIPELLKLGKENIYIWKIDEGKVHENQAAIRIAQAIIGPGIRLSEPIEGKVSLIADYQGLFTVDENLLVQLNMMDEIVIATRSNRRPVNAGDILAGVRVVPLVIDDYKLQTLERICAGQPIVQVKPFQKLTAGIITTGNEVFKGRITDKFGPVVKKKIEDYDCNVLNHIIVPDDAGQISGAVNSLVEQGVELILTTGGMSVDPDDVTPRAVREAGAEIITYGAPVLPGAMIMVAYMKDIPILGLPGCVMYHATTIFDLLLPSVLAGERITKPMVARLGLGGLCLNCAVCRYPVCSFGTGA